MSIYKNSRFGETSAVDVLPTLTWSVIALRPSSLVKGSRHFHKASTMNIATTFTSCWSLVSDLFATTSFVGCLLTYHGDDDATINLWSLAHHAKAPARLRLMRA